MYKNNKFVFTIVLIGVFLILTPLAFSACTTSPQEIVVSSGQMNLGGFISGDDLYVKPDMFESPLKFEFVFKDNQEGCFDSTVDVKIKLFEDGATVPVDTITTIQEGEFYITRAIATFRVDAVLTESSTASYSVESSGNSPQTGILYLYSDDIPPTITISANVSLFPGVFKKDTPVKINYTISDSQSALSQITISGTGKSTQVILFNERNTTYTGGFNDILSTTKTFTFTSQDKLGNTNTESITLSVDVEPPKIIKNFVKDYTYDGLTRRISFKDLVIEDDYFAYLTSPPKINADFSQINPAYTQVAGDCSKISDTSYNCDWENLEINIDSTKTAQINIYVIDDVGNSKTYSFNEEIIVDNAGPVFEEFYVENDLGARNIMSAYQGKAMAVMEFTDSSIEALDSTWPIIIEDFDGRSFPSSMRECTFETGGGRCEWNLSTYKEIYKGVKTGTINFNIILKDRYRNTNEQTLTITIDNTLPVIKEITFEEKKDALRDGVIQSQETVDFILLIEDENIMQGSDHFIYGDFSAISRQSGAGNIKAECSPYDEKTTQCKFENIKVGNGYVKRDVKFLITDTAENSEIVDYEVEVLQLGDEVFSSYSIPNIKITNPIFRSFIMERSSVYAFFEGKIEQMDLDEGTQIVNYQLRECLNTSSFAPPDILEFGLFPQPVIYNRNQKDADKFALRIELKNHPNAADLNEKKLSCTMSILKRDQETLYPAELVNFTLVFEFTGNASDNLIRAQAENILSDITKAEGIGKWSDGAYGVYKVFNDICTTFSGINIAFSSISTAWQSVSLALRGTAYGTPIAEGGDKVITPTQGILSKLGFEGLGKGITAMCDFVTCRHGGLIKTEKVLGPLIEAQDNLGGTLCEIPINAFKGGEEK